VATRRETDI